MAATHGTSVRIFLPDGTPDGLRLVEKSNWTGRAAMCSRSQYPDVRGRAEFSGPGIYVLIGRSETGIDRQLLYIGQADVARTRLDNHLQNKDFWTQLILFTSKDSNLNRAHVQYVESRLITLVHRAKRADLTNGNIPNAPSLSEADVADAESFLADMLTIYPLLGVSAFEQIEQAVAATQTHRLALSGGKAKAEGQDSSLGFLVFKGATASAQVVPSTPEWVLRIRNELLSNGVLVKTANGLLLADDFVFDSPSAAAAVLQGSSANGRKVWKDALGRTLAELQAEQAGLTPSTTHTHGLDDE